MALKESDMRAQVVRLLAGANAVAVENGVGVGTPDVNYVEGWLELKSVDLPKNPDSPIRVPHFSAEQRLWLRRRTEAGGRAHVLLKAGNWWILLSAMTAAESLGTVPLGWLIDHCVDGWAGRPSGDALLEALRRDTK